MNLMKEGQINAAGEGESLIKQTWPLWVGICRKVSANRECKCCLSAASPLSAHTWGKEIVVQPWKGKIDYFKVLKAVPFVAVIGIYLSFHPVLLALEHPE